MILLAAFIKYYYTLLLPFKDRFIWLHLHGLDCDRLDIMITKNPISTINPVIMRLCLQIKEPNAYGNSALHLACFNGQDLVVNELIEAGAEVNQVNEKGFSPLHFTAASRQGALCLELLIANGANLNSKVSESCEENPHLLTTCQLKVG